MLTLLVVVLVPVVGLLVADTWPRRRSRRLSMNLPPWRRRAR